MPNLRAPIRLPGFNGVEALKAFSASAAGAGGTYSVIVSATNSSGTATAPFALTVNEAPTLTGPTSAGFANSLGRPDGRVALDEAVEHCRQLSAATDLPLSADL